MHWRRVDGLVVHHLRRAERGRIVTVDVLVLIGDCLRADSATNRTTPFCRATADVTFDRCYVPGTWTLPSHASLYTGTTPIDHGVTRRGERLTAEQAWLPHTARSSGYETALFSENPTFSSRFGFDAEVDYVDDFVNSTPLRSTFAAERVVETVALRETATLARAVARSDRPHVDLLNLLYTPFGYALDRRSARYRHNGDRVVSHLAGYLNEREEDDDPVLAFVNLLDPHNPHSVPPDAGARALGIEVPREERLRLAAANDNKQFLLEEREQPPARTREQFESWEAVFRRREQIYEAQVRYFDLLVERLADRASDRFDDALVLVTGDHGQLFGEEGMVGHHTSLHPHGIQVPLFVSTPAEWDDGPAAVGTGSAGGGDGASGVGDGATGVGTGSAGVDVESAGVGTGSADSGGGPADGGGGAVDGGGGAVGVGGGPADGGAGSAAGVDTSSTADAGASSAADGVGGAGTTVDRPVSLVGLSRALGDVVSGDVASTASFVDRICEASGGPAGVCTVADGPTWNVDALTASYDPEAVQRLAVRRVGVVDGHRQVVCSSPWRSSECRTREYELADGGRRLVAEHDRHPIESTYRDWLVPERSERGTATVSTRLEQLGYQ